MSTDPRRTAMALHPSADRCAALDTDVLSAVAAGLGSVVDTCKAEPARSVQRSRILATEGYDVWLMTWGPDSAADAHDHAGSISVVHVVAGELVEETVDILGTESVGRSIRSGTTTALSSVGRHSLANRTDRTSVSVHVYSPPIGDQPG